jgi:hypothetical protein
MISFENIPAMKLREFYFLIDQLKYVKYIIGVFQPFHAQFKSKRLKALTTLKKVKKKPKTREDLQNRIKSEMKKEGYKYDNTPTKI